MSYKQLCIVLNNLLCVINKNIKKTQMTVSWLGEWKIKSMDCELINVC